MTHRLNWDDLQFILSVAENGSLSAAARDLGVNHATVLRRVKTFEHTYGIQLFERKSSGYLLTVQSKTIIATLRSIQRSVAGLERSFTGLGSPFEGNICITSTDTICRGFLIPHIQMLSLLHPNLEIELLSTNNRLDISGHEADITIRPTLSLPEDLTGEVIGSMRFGIYATPEYWAQNTSSDYTRHKWLGVSDQLLRSPVGIWQNEVLSNQLALRSDSFLNLCQLAELGMGPTALPQFIGDTSDKLVLSQDMVFDAQTDIWVATHRDLATMPRIQALMGYFIDIFKEHRHLFSSHTSASIKS